MLTAEQIADVAWTQRQALRAHGPHIRATKVEMDPEDYATLVKYMGQKVNDLDPVRAVPMDEPVRPGPATLFGLPIEQVMGKKAPVVVWEIAPAWRPEFEAKLPPWR